MTRRLRSRALVRYAETLDAETARELDADPEMIAARNEVIARQATLDKPTWGGAIGEWGAEPAVIDWPAEAEADDDNGWAGPEAVGLLHQLDGSERE